MKEDFIIEDKILRLNRLLSVLTDKSGREIRLGIIYNLIASDGEPIEIESLRQYLGTTRSTLFGHLRRLYETELISNPTRKKTIHASERLNDLAPALVNLYERI